MTSLHELSAELEALFNGFLDDTISDDGMCKLSAELDQSLVARSLFLQYCQLHLELVTEVEVDKISGGVRNVISPAPDCFRKTDVPIIDALDQQGSLAGKGIVLPFGIGFRIPAIAFVLGVLLAVFCYEVWLKTPRDQLDVNGINQRSDLAVEAVAPEPLNRHASQLERGSENVLSNVNDSQLSDGKTSPVSSVHLDAGSANLKLPGVGYVIVEGPAEFDLVNPMRARLKRGRIKMRVTEKTGHGFTVETPFGNVMDLGTEFGLDVSEKGQAGVVVFDGAVDLQVAESSEKPDFSRVERLERGEGLTFWEGGKLNRIMSIVTGSAATFQQHSEVREGAHAPVILDVTDNRRTTETRKFYEIVPGGLREDAQAYVDRPQHDWNGVTSAGMSSYLIGADYVKPFNDDKIQKDIEIDVTLGRPAKLYVFFDDRLSPPGWLRRGFRKTDDKIGLDVGDWSGSVFHYQRGDGPGVSIDTPFSIWEQVVKTPGTVRLGNNTKSENTRSGMYGIAAVAMDVEKDVSE